MQRVVFSLCSFCTGKECRVLTKEFILIIFMYQHASIINILCKVLNCLTLVKTKVYHDLFSAEVSLWEFLALYCDGQVISLFT